ncbi:MAG: hypothetical protein M1831_006463 [Alyxoria varia]|nr:MAG: hypothetical protein M1831_006463 [Alyxoria varia]
METCCTEQGMINYVPTTAGNAVYLAIFAVALIAQIGLGVRYKTWDFMGPMVAGTIMEIFGYAGRLWMTTDIFTMSPFLMYLIPLTIGPAFYAAAIYLCLGRIVIVYGTQYSPLRPRTYTIIFVCFDFVSLLLQAVGGALTSVAETTQNRDIGVNVMIAGLAFQVFSLFLFMSVCTAFAVNVIRSRKPANPKFTQLRSRFVFRAFQAAIALSTITIFIRCCYRVAELQAGFAGDLANDEVLFMILEGPMVFIAVLALTFFHPGIGYGQDYITSEFSFSRNKMGDELEQQQGEKLEGQSEMRDSQ